MLNSAEELLLFLLDEPNATLLPLTRRTEELVFAGAVLMNLQIENRIDSDLDNFMLASSEPIGDDVLDPVLAEISSENGTSAERDAVYWLERTAKRGREIRDAATASLVKRGILLDPEDEGDAGSLTLSPDVAHARTYPTTNGKPQEDVKLRVMRVLFTGTIPRPEDVVVISLVEAAGLWRKVLTKPELAKARRSIDTFSQLDLIGQAVKKLVQIARTPSRVGAKELKVVPGLPIFGSTFDIMRDQREFYLKNHRRFGPVYRVKALTRDLIVLSGKEANLFVTYEERSHLQVVPDVWQYVCRYMGAGRFMLNTNGTDHLQMRRKLKHGFSRTAMEQRLDEAVEVLRTHLLTLPLNKPQVGVSMSQRLMAETAGFIGVNTPPEDYVNDALLVMRAAIFRGLAKRPAIRADMGARKAGRRLVALADKMLVAHQLKQRGRSRDIVDELLELHRADPTFMPQIDLAINALLPMFAGVDTAAGVACSMLYRTLRDPDILERATAEADALFADGPPEPKAARTGLDIANRLMLECLRLYTPVPGQMKTVATSFDFAGYHIPAGEVMTIAGTVTHGLEEHFPDPERFDIDRYLPPRNEHKERGVFNPFGIGTHHCLGRGFATTLLPLMLATMLHYAEWEVHPSSYKLKMMETPFRTPDKKLKFKITRWRQ